MTTPEDDRPVGEVPPEVYGKPFHGWACTCFQMAPQYARLPDPDRPCPIHTPEHDGPVGEVPPEGLREAVADTIRTWLWNRKHAAFGPTTPGELADAVLAALPTRSDETWHTLLRRLYDAERERDEARRVIHSGATRKQGEHTWVLAPVDPAGALEDTIRDLRASGAVKEADRLARRAHALTASRDQKGEAQSEAERLRAGIAALVDRGPFVPVRDLRDLIEPPLDFGTPLDGEVRP